MMTSHHILPPASRLAAALLSLAAALIPAAAQDLHQVVEVERDVELTHRDFSPMRSFPTVTPPALQTSALSYSSRLRPVPVTPTGNIYEPVSWTDPRDTKPWKGYASLGYWPVLHLDASAGYRFIDTDRTRLSLWGQLNSATYKARGTEHRHTALGVGADLRQAIGRESYIDAMAAYRYSSFNPPFTPASGPEDTWNQYANEVSAALAWHSAEQSFRYNAALAYDYFGYRNPLPGAVPFAQTAGTDASLREPMRQNCLSLLADGRLPLTEHASLGLDLGLDFLIGSRHGAEASLSITDPHWSLSPATHKNDFLLTLTPRWLLDNDHFNANVGLRLDYGRTPKSALHLAPDVKLAWRPASFITLSADVTGGNRLNTLHELFGENYLAAPMMSYSQSFIPVDAELRLLLGPRRAIWLELAGGYSKASDWLMPQLSGGTSFFAPQQISGWRGQLALGAAWKELAELKASATFAPADYTKGYYRWRDRAKCVLTAALTVHPVSAIDVTLGYELRTRRSIMAERIGFLESVPTAARLATPLHNLSDLSLDALWRIDARWSLFLSLDNMLCRRSTLTVGGVPMEGFNGLVGIGCKF